MTRSSDAHPAHGEPTYLQPTIETHSIQSTHVAQVFKLKIRLPMRRADGIERFSVVYATDADEVFNGLANIAYFLQIHGETPRFILVGIGYDNEAAAGLLRMRDLFTREVRQLVRSETEQFAQSPLGAGFDDLRAIYETTDACEFLAFIRQELVPFIDARYPTIPADRSFCGYSAGAGFGLYTLFSQPDSFGRYVLGSPATSYDGNNFAIAMAQAYLESRQPLNARVFMSVGELEEFKWGLGHLDLVSGYYLLSKFLKKAAISGLDLTVRVFPGETHATAWPGAFNHGLKSVLGPAETVPFWPAYLK